MDMEREAQRKRSFWIVVLNVELADLAFSLDNVVAAVSLSDKLWVVMIGVALGIVTMRFAAGIFTWMIKREPDPRNRRVHRGLQYRPRDAAWRVRRHPFRGVAEVPDFGFDPRAVRRLRARAHSCTSCPVFRWMAEGMGNINELINWALRPFVGLIKLIFRGLVQIVRPLLPAHGNTGAGV